MDERVFQNRGVCRQAFPFLFSLPTSRPFLRSPPIFARPKSETVESLRETLATQANGEVGQHWFFLVLKFVFYTLIHGERQEREEIHRLVLAQSCAQNSKNGWMKSVLGDKYRVETG